MSSARSITWASAAALLFLGLLSNQATAQGGWRQWDVHLRDGRHIVANPLGAPSDRHVSTAVQHDTAGAIPRNDVDYIAARTDRLEDPHRNRPLPRPPARRCSRDVVVRLDGRRTYGAVTLEQIRFSEGFITQNGVRIDLSDIAYIKFGRKP